VESTGRSCREVGANRLPDRRQAPQPAREDQPLDRHGARDACGERELALQSRGLHDHRVERVSDQLDEGPPRRERSDADLPGARAVADKLEPVRRVYAKWMDAKWREPSVPISVIKYWSQLLGFTGGNPREPGRPLSDERKRELKQDLTAIGLL